MICIYMIENKINGKKYIGQTANFQSRKNGHFTSLRCKTHHSKRLQNAFNKYGENNFEMKPIIECQIDEMNDLEKYYIWLYNSYYAGYNMSKSTDDRPYSCRKIKWNNKTYRSVVEAATDLNINAGVLYGRLYKGHTSDKTINNNYNGIKTTWNGVEYSSISECAKANKMRADTLRWRIKRGYKSDDDMMRTSDPRQIIINNKIYKSVSEASRDLGMDRKTIRRKYLKKSNTNLTKT